MASYGVSRMEIRRTFIFLFILTFSPLRIAAEIWGYEGERNIYTRYIWEFGLNDFDQDNYSRGIKELFFSFEEKTGKELKPGKKRRAGIKVYTNSGSGIATPLPLVKAVIDELLSRGFRAHELFILDLNETRLRYSGYIPLLSRREGMQFDGVPVSVLDSQQYFDPIWYYDSALPSKSGMALSPDLLRSYDVIMDRDGRKSFLPKPLLTDVDFWINLPMAMDHPAVGVSGAIVNATLWNISNRDRFFVSPANAPIAAAEIAAIPEMMASLAMTILPLERYQYIGGPVFNSLYTRSEPVIWMSVNPVVLDALMLQRINAHRKESGFLGLGERLPMLQFAEALGLGTQDISRMQWIRVE